MRIGYMVGEGNGTDPDLAALIERGRRVEAAGLDTACIAEVEIDAATASAALGMVTQRIEIGTGVVPTPMRHPYALAHQAATTQQACGGRFVLGVGLSHKLLVENALGLSYERPVRQMREYLEILGTMLRGEAVSYSGELYSAHFRAIPLGTPVPVLVAALGPQMLRVAGRFAGGTVAWACGARTIEGHIAPGIRQAASEAGRPEPRVVASFPVAVTADADAARESAARTFAHYKALPSYRAMLDREGVEGLEDLAIAGDEATVRAGLARIEAAGATDFCAVAFDAGEGAEERTLELLGEIAREKSQ